MGQYFIAVNHTKRELIDPHEIGHAGAKFHHQLAPDGLAAAVFYAVSHYGEWGGDSVEVIGDEHDCYRYHDCCDNYTDVSDKIKPLLNEWADYWQYLGGKKVIDKEEV